MLNTTTMEKKNYVQPLTKKLSINAKAICSEPDLVPESGLVPTVYGPPDDDEPEIKDIF